jgi:putative FmdB family regulatory protein
MAIVSKLKSSRWGDETMPIYEYMCKDCNTQFERFVRSMTADSEVQCPHCGGHDVKKGWSVFGTSGATGLGSLSAAPQSSCDTGGT